MGFPRWAGNVHMVCQSLGQGTPSLNCTQCSPQTEEAFHPHRSLGWGGGGGNHRVEKVIQRSDYFLNMFQQSLLILSPFTQFQEYLVLPGLELLGNSTGVNFNSQLSLHLSYNSAFSDRLHQLLLIHLFSGYLFVCHHHLSFSLVLWVHVGFNPLLSGFSEV